MQLISLTSGSKPILTNIINKHPQHQLYLYKSSTENTFKLIDWYPNKNIFKLPITYHILKASNSIKKGPFVNLLFFTMDRKQFKIFSACFTEMLTASLPANMLSILELQDIEDPSKILITTTWQSNAYYIAWIHHSFIYKFMTDPNNACFHNNLIHIR